MYEQATGVITWITSRPNVSHEAPAHFAIYGGLTGPYFQMLLQIRTLLSNSITS